MLEGILFVAALLALFAFCYWLIEVGDPPLVERFVNWLGREPAVEPGPGETKDDLVTALNELRAEALFENRAAEAAILDAEIQEMLASKNL